MKYVLPQMGSFLGCRLFEGGTYFEDDRVQRSISLADWNSIVRFYVSRAPEGIPSAERTHVVQSALTDFETVSLPFIKFESATTFIAIDSTNHSIVFGDGVSRQLYRYDTALTNVIDSIPAGVGLSDLIAENGNLFMLSMGVLTPSDALKGSLSVFNQATRKDSVILDSLQRPVHAEYVDLNADGRKDFLICEFGNTAGRLAWYEQTEQARYRLHVLRPLPGAVHTQISDLNKDGRPDIIALMAQGDEGMFVYYNLGNGQFKESRILQFSPAFGSNYFQLYDFNKDGHPDIVATNGDNGDYPPILKPYHGIRIYINDGKNNFSEKLFIHVDGASKVLVADLNDDSQPDLASIAYFADYEKHPEEAFVVWVNLGDMAFRGQSFPAVNAGRWLTMDAGDMDGDGDIDIALGNANFAMGKIPAALKNQWNRSAPSVMVLRNISVRSSDSR